MQEFCVLLVLLYDSVEVHLFTSYYLLVYFSFCCNIVNTIFNDLAYFQYQKHPLKE
jgi:hypothetical protein